MRRTTPASHAPERVHAPNRVRKHLRKSLLLQSAARRRASFVHLLEVRRDRRTAAGIAGGGALALEPQSPWGIVAKTPGWLRSGFRMHRAAARQDWPATL